MKIVTSIIIINQRYIVENLFQIAGNLAQISPDFFVMVDFKNIEKSAISKFLDQGFRFFVIRLQSLPKL